MVRQGIGSDTRIGTQFLYTGCGYGGSCSPKDVKALIRSGRDVDFELQVLSAVESVNDRQKNVLVDKVVQRFGSDLSGRRFALWGLAFKPGTDDMREAASLTIERGLTERGAVVCAYDPVVISEARSRMKEWNGVEFAANAIDATVGADALVIVTEWKEFRSPDLDALRRNLRQPLIFDGRNLFDPADVAELGFDYRCVGRARASVSER